MFFKTKMDRLMLKPNVIKALASPAKQQIVETKVPVAKHSPSVSVTDRAKQMVANSFECTPPKPATDRSCGSTEAPLSSAASKMVEL